MVRPELLFLIYKCCFFARDRDGKWLRAELSFGEISGPKQNTRVARSAIVLSQRPTGQEAVPHSVFHDIILSKFVASRPLQPVGSTATGQFSRVIRLVTYNSSAISYKHKHGHDKLEMFHFPRTPGMHSISKLLQNIFFLNL